MSLMRDWLQMARPLNGLMVAVMALVSYAIASDWHMEQTPAYILGLACFLMVSGQAMFNDWVDIEVDRRGKPNRPLPAGRVSHPAVLTMSLLLTGLSVWLMKQISWQAVTFFAAVGCLLMIYSVWAKYQVGILANLLCACLVASVSFTGCLIAGNWNRMWTIALAPFFATLAREVVKDIEDLYGDFGLKQRTVPMLLTPAQTMWVVDLLVIAQLITSYAPTMIHVLTWRYALAVSVPNAFLVWAMFQPSCQAAPRLQWVLKLTMCFYLFAYLAG